jgi:hypothetical protein
MALTCVALGQFDEAFDLYREALETMGHVENGELEQAITYLNMADAVEAQANAGLLADDSAAEHEIERLLDTALDARGGVVLAPAAVREWLVSRWDDHLQGRLERATEQRALTLMDNVRDDLAKRENEELARVEGIFSAFRLNLKDSLEELREVERELYNQPTLWVDDQRRQRTRDIQLMRDRLSTLGMEEKRELEAVTERYRDIKPYVTIAALVFAVSPDDAKEWGDR